nr:hypothetical protein BaRGS_004341 [Batillaria attramentaria]
MPCRITTKAEYWESSAALVWAGQIMKEATPPNRTHPDQVFVFHNHEPQKPDWIGSPSFRKRSWQSAFNWTMSYRSDSDIVAPYGLIRERRKPGVKNYTDILARKTKFAAWLVSNCHTDGRREDYVKKLQKYVSVDVYGACGPFKCPRSQDNACFKKFSTDYKFYLSFESAVCQDYVSEKFFRYMDTDAVVVARGNGHKILQAKDGYVPVYEEYPIRNKKGNIGYMVYRHEAVSFCQLCRRLWDLQDYRKTIHSFSQWFDKGNCKKPQDI